MLATIGTILVFILKLIGIILLSILGLIIFVLLVILFVPFRYQAEGSFDEKIHIKVKFSWLLHLINGYFVQQDKESQVRVRIAFFQIFPKKPSKKKETVHTTSLPKVPVVKEQAAQAPEKKVVEKPSTDIEIKEKEEQKKVIQKKVEPKKVEPKKVEAKKNEPKKTKKEKAKDKPSAIDQIKEVWEFLQQDNNKGLLKHILKYVGRLIRWIFPKKAYGNIEFGLDDPATTGYITGATSLIYIKTRGNFQFTPNFHEQVIKGAFKIKGRLYLYQPLYYIIRIIIDRRVRRMLKFLRNR